MAPERQIIAAIKRYGLATDAILVMATKLPRSVAKAARRRLVRSGAVVRWKAVGGRMAWRVA